MAELVVRQLQGEAELHDLAALHARAWQWTYRGLVPDALLESRTPTNRLAVWRQWLAAKDSRRRLWLAWEGLRLVGFVASGPSRDADAAVNIAEILALYLEPAVVGTGVGRCLFAHAVAHLRSQEFTVARLWVLATNTRAQHFYARAGWRPDGATETRQGMAIPSVRYVLDLTATPLEGEPGRG
jgi:ribosomal protein S18 acetylase RimI-like enzyme